MREKMPNIVTALRIVGAAVLIFLTPLTLEFYIVYAVCGISDMLDGALAREYNCESKFGQTFDGIADAAFIIVVACKMFSYLYIPAWAFLWTLGVLFVKLASLTVGGVKYHRPAFLHTTLNKAAGIVLLLFPFNYYIFGIEITAALCLVIASAASIEELVINITSVNLDCNVKTIFPPRKKKAKKKRKKRA